MDTLLNCKLGNENVERRVKNTNDSSLADDRAKALCEVGDEEAQEQVSGLLLSEFGVSLLAVKQTKTTSEGCKLEDGTAANMLHC